MKVKVSFVVVSVLCVCILAGTFFIIKFAPKKNSFPRMGGASQEQEATSVRTMAAVQKTLHAYVDTNGEIECESSVDCYPDIGGKIARVYVSLGDTVKKGDVLAEVDPSEPGAYYVNSSVYAPISGMITSTPKEIGTTVASSTAITTIGDVSNLQIRAKVPERYVSFLKRGLNATIILEAYPDEKFSATVKKVSPVLDSQSRTKEILLSFNKADSRINAGMFAKLTLFTADYAGKVVVPLNSIVEKNGKNYVFIFDEDESIVKLREVELGNSVDNMIQVVSGIYEGEKVVVEGMTSVSDGSKVRNISSGLNAE